VVDNQRRWLAPHRAPEAADSAASGRIAELLDESPGVLPEEVFVDLLEAAKENWSLGRDPTQFV